MILLKWRVFKLVLLLAVALTMPSIKAQTAMTEIPLGGTSSGGAAAQTGFCRHPPVADTGGSTYTVTATLPVPRQ